MDSLFAISPLDGRYQQQTKLLSPYFSEAALFKYRLKLEVEYLIAFTALKETKIKRLAAREQNFLRGLYLDFSLADARHIKKIEDATKHDLKAVEIFLRSKLKGRLKTYIPFLHFALTSEDINNLAYSLMWQEGLKSVYIPEVERLVKLLAKMAKNHRNLSLLSLTHGQPATPTTLGKEMAVFAARLKKQMEVLLKCKLCGKLNGATGTFSAHILAYPKIDWIKFSKKFISSLGLTPNLLTTQVENYDSLAESLQTVARLNTIMIDLSRDMWLYISRGIFSQKLVSKEVGSSTMPHKINPINFENAEGNCSLSVSCLSHLASTLPISRLQRDLSSSTLLRNLGVALAHSYLAGKSLIIGLAKLRPNQKKIKNELENHWEILAEAVQTILRKHGQTEAYEKIKIATKGRVLTENDYRQLVKNLVISEKEKDKLLALRPETYTGLAGKLADFIP